MARFEILLLALRAQKVSGSFEKRAPEPESGIRNPEPESRIWNRKPESWIRNSESGIRNTQIKDNKFLKYAEIT